MLKLKIGIRDHMPDPKYYLEVSQTMLFKQFRESHPSLHISQRVFESLKPFYYVPLKYQNTYCCKYHVEFSMHYELLCSIYSTLHSKKMLENCGASGLPKSSRDLIDQFLCHRVHGCFFYRNACLNEKCSQCGGLSKFHTCFHEECKQDLAKIVVKKKVYEMVKYTLKSGGEGSRCELVAKEISVASFILDFKTNIFYKCTRHTHKSQWLDQQFRMSKKTFPIGTIISVVDFAENYTL